MIRTEPNIDVRVSTIIRVFNAETTVGPAIDSALAQDFVGQEIIVVDDGSTDGTPDILRSYGAKIRVIRQENHGCAFAGNAGVRASSGQYIAFLDADDVWYADKLRSCVKALDGNPAAVLAFSSFIKVGDRGSRIAVRPGRAPSHNELFELKPASPPSGWVIRSQAYLCCGGFSEEFFGAGGFDDTYLSLRLSELGEFIYVPEVLFEYHQTESPGWAEKYLPGRKIFVRLVKTRYPAKWRVARKAVDHLLSPSLLALGILRLDKGKSLAALKCFLLSFWLWPLYVAWTTNPFRLLNKRNQQRLRAMCRFSRSPKLLDERRASAGTRVSKASFSTAPFSSKLGPPAAVVNKET